MILRYIRRALSVMLVAGMAAAAAAAQPVARVLEVQGKATAKDDAGKQRPLSALDTVYLGDRLVLAANCHVVLAFRSDGHLERLKLPGEVAVGKQGCEPKTSVEVVQVPQRHAKTVDGTIRQLQPSGPGGVTIVRSPAPPGRKSETPEMSRQITPIAGATVLTARPKFCWLAVPKAARYDVRLYADGKEVWSATTKQTQIEYARKAPLKAGIGYDWSVAAGFENGTSTQPVGGMFTVATEEQIAQVAQLQQLAAESETAYVALAAVWFEEHDFMEQAIAAYERLVALQPDSAAYHLALYRLYQQAERRADAEKAYKKARELQPPPAKSARPAWLPTG
jgi:hypothetical protein